MEHFPSAQQWNYLHPRSEILHLMRTEATMSIVGNKLRMKPGATG
ncbi:hypothetical protein HMPREF9412_1021 [Paenibacillus sp. HGF5]|nr:hypothetical protein HMPREF9412_1021 [Paenibacillus sp. HGF5]